MSNMQNISPPNLRIDYSRADMYTRPEPPKLTFWQKLGRGLGKFMSFAGPIGAAISTVALGPIGLPVAAGLYGLTKLSNDMLARAEYKDQMMAAASMPQGPITMPGLFETSPIDAGEMATEFIAPSYMEPNIYDVIIQRDSLQKEAVETLRY